MIDAMWMLALASATPTDELAAAPSDPVPIVGGTEVSTCQFPSVVSIREGDDTPTMCSGSLVHPQVVLIAAHCVIPERPIVGIGFGEFSHDFGEPQFVVAPVECVPHPDYPEWGIHDVGYCTLAEPVTDVPIVPVLAGCEADALQPGTDVTIVGFGATYGTYEDEMVTASGVGAKRYTTQTIDSIDMEVGEVNMSGPNGSQSACFGDSGGPAMVELSDGTWRVFGVGSHLYDPGGLPGPIEPGNVCGTGVAYGYASPQIEWLESQTGFDLTPCWDGDTFVGGDGCGSFPQEPDLAFGSWDVFCVGGAVGGGDEVCEVVGEDTGGTDDSGETTGGETSGGETTGGDGTGIATVDDTGGGAEASDDSIADDGTDDGAPLTTDPTDASDSSSSGVDQTGDDPSGCGCTTDARPSAMLWILAVALRRRRRG